MDTDMQGSRVFALGIEINMSPGTRIDPMDIAEQAMKRDGVPMTVAYAAYFSVPCPVDTVVSHDDGETQQERWPKLWADWWRKHDVIPVVVTDPACAKDIPDLIAYRGWLRLRDIFDVAQENARQIQAAALAAVHTWYHARAIEALRALKLMP